MVFRTASKHYALAALTLVYTLSLVDQGLITLLLEPIKESLHLTDTQLGFLTGIGFALTYATLGLPIARWADGGNRNTIASFMIGLWGAMMMACLVVINFAQLVIARLTTGVGAAGAMPATYSLVGDYFPGSLERTRAMTIYMLANPLSMLLSFAAGGLLNHLYGWRYTFFLMGTPAILLAFLVKASVAEPRVVHNQPEPSREALPRLSAVLSAIWRCRTTRHLTIALILLYTMGFGISPWYGAFMIRSHHAGDVELGVWFALTFGFGGVAGVLLGGYVSAGWFAHNEQAQMRMIALATGLLVPCFGFFLLLPTKRESLLALFPLMIVFNVFFGPVFALMQRLVADEIRATTIAVVMLLYNLIGMGIGPQVVGTLSDVLSPWAGSDSLRYSMLGMSVVSFWSAYHFWRAGRTIRVDLRAVADQAQSHVKSLSLAVLTGE